MTLLLVLACAAAPPDPPVAVSPSLYTLPTRFQDQRGREVDLAIGRGHPTLVSMFYATCPTACPMLIADLHAIEDALPADARADLRVVLVSLDPEHDTRSNLARYAEDHALDERWSLLHADTSGVREVAAVLGARYAPLPSGDIEHSVDITLLDREGRILRRFERGASPDRDVVPAILALP